MGSYRHQGCRTRFNSRWPEDHRNAECPAQRSGHRGKGSFNSLTGAPKNTRGQECTSHRPGLRPPTHARPLMFPTPRLSGLRPPTHASPDMFQLTGSSDGGCAEVLNWTPRLSSFNSPADVRPLEGTDRDHRQGRISTHLSPEVDARVHVSTRHSPPVQGPPEEDPADAAGADVDVSTHSRPRG